MCAYDRVHLGIYFHSSIHYKGLGMGTNSIVVRPLLLGSTLQMPFPQKESGFLEKWLILYL